MGAQWNTKVDQCGGTVEQSWWDSVVGSGKVMVEQWKSNSGTVWWNSGTVMVEQCGGTVWWNSEGETV